MASAPSAPDGSGSGVAVPVEPPYGPVPSCRQHRNSPRRRRVNRQRRGTDEFRSGMTRDGTNKRHREQRPAQRGATLNTTSQTFLSTAPEVLTIRDPRTGDVVGRFPSARAEDVAQAV